MAKHSKPIPFAAVESRIHLIRGNKVMLDSDLAQLYGVATKNLNKAVARNRARFPEDFMFQLAAQELADLRFQIGTSNQRGGQRYLPYAFTQEGSHANQTHGKRTRMEGDDGAWPVGQLVVGSKLGWKF